MVKGISRQVIVVQSPDPKLFDQAIFILKEDALRHGGISDDALLKEARSLIKGCDKKPTALRYYGPVWACGGAMLTGIAWLLSVLL